jgi:Spy/CpxP family protein refolding chaperone
MKKVAILSLVALVALALSGVASAHMWGDDDGGPGYGMGPGMMFGGGDDTGKPVDVEKFKKFQKETSALRDEMHIKMLELRNEYAKENPDEGKIASLQKEMIDLRTKIHTAADKAGIERPGRGRFGKRGGGRHMGPGMMYGGGPGNCPNW